MCKVVSLRDLRSFPELSAYKEVELINPKMDAVIKPYLYMMGIDTDYAVEYTVNNHRDMNDKTGVGYRIVGEIRCDREFRHSPYCDLVDMLTVTGFHDPSLTKELSEMTNRTVDLAIFSEEDDTSYVDVDFTSDLVEQDYIEVSNVMHFMRQELLAVRGSFVTFLH